MRVYWQQPWGNWILHTIWSSDIFARFFSIMTLCEEFPALLIIDMWLWSGYLFWKQLARVIASLQHCHKYSNFSPPSSHLCSVYRSCPSSNPKLGSNLCLLSCSCIYCPCFHRWKSCWRSWAWGGTLITKQVWHLKQNTSLMWAKGEHERVPDDDDSKQDPEWSINHH